jgi:hypothetical protein
MFKNYCKKLFIHGVAFFLPLDSYYNVVAFHFGYFLIPWAIICGVHLWVQTFISGLVL